MEMWLLLAIAIWAGLCFYAIRQLWRMVRWGRVTAIVLGHPKKHAPKEKEEKGALLVAFQARNNQVLIHTYLPAKYPRLVLQARWPVNCPVEVAYDPFAPTNVRWPPAPHAVALCGATFAIPAVGVLLAWLWQMM